VTAWSKVEPFTGRVHQGCLCCPPVTLTASLETIVAVGFGEANITRDGEIVYQERDDDEGTFRTLAEFEELAAADPDHDWRMFLLSPLKDREYQRHGVGLWVLIASGPGFA